jgi:hypothetical protein
VSELIVQDLWDILKIEFLIDPFQATASWCSILHQHYSKAKSPLQENMLAELCREFTKVFNHCYHTARKVSYNSILHCNGATMMVPCVKTQKATKISVSVFPLPIYEAYL